ncbi:gpW family head-tail joining protein [Escherichia coli]
MTRQEELAAARAALHDLMTGKTLADYARALSGEDE